MKALSKKPQLKIRVRIGNAGHGLLEINESIHEIEIAVRTVLMAPLNDTLATALFVGRQNEMSDRDGIICEALPGFQNTFLYNLAIILRFNKLFLAFWRTFQIKDESVDPLHFFKTGSAEITIGIEDTFDRRHDFLKCCAKGVDEVKV